MVDGEGDAGATTGHLDMTKQQAPIRVFVNAQQREEGEEEGAPVSRI